MGSHGMRRRTKVDIQDSRVVVEAIDGVQYFNIDNLNTDTLNLILSMAKEEAVETERARIRNSIMEAFSL